MSKITDLSTYRKQKDYREFYVNDVNDALVFLVELIDHTNKTAPIPRMAVTAFSEGLKEYLATCLDFSKDDPSVLNYARVVGSVQDTGYKSGEFVLRYHNGVTLGAYQPLTMTPHYMGMMTSRVLDIPQLPRQYTESVRKALKDALVSATDSVPDMPCTQGLLWLHTVTALEEKGFCCSNYEHIGNNIDISMTNGKELCRLTFDLQQLTNTHQAILTNRNT